jgi:hypothetical protein
MSGRQPNAADEVQISAKAKKLTPVLEDKVNVTEGQAQLIAEFVGSPVYNVIKKIVVPQRKDQIARRSLSEAENYEQILFHRGEVYELGQFFKLLHAIKTQHTAAHTDESEKQFKK